MDYSFKLFLGLPNPVELIGFLGIPPRAIGVNFV